jgi:hypothetical protein
MTRPTKTDSRTGKENKLLSKKELEGKLKDELLKEISLGEKKIVRSYIFKESRSSFSNIWDNKTSILLSKKKNKVEFVLSIHFTPIVMDKKAEVSMILLPKK